MSGANEPKVPWSGRGNRFTDEEIDYIVEAMKTADPMTQGRYQAEFECDFAGFVEQKHAFAVTSGTAALQMAAALTRVGPGDDVIIPAHTFAASAIPFGHMGANLVWADIDPDTLVVTGDAIARVLTPKTKVIVVVHLYGLMVDMDPIMKLAKERGILVVEDCAQSLGATDDKDRQAGSIGDFGCYSFHTHKNMSTLGEGGMLTVRDDDLAAVVPGLRHNGMRGFDFAQDEYWKPAMSNVDFDWDNIWPYNFCMGEVQCAAGIVQLRRVNDMNAKRDQRARRFAEALSGFPELVFQHTPDGYHNIRYCLPARYDGTETDATRDDFMRRMAHHHQVKMVVQYYPLYRYPMFIKAGFGDADCPETDRFFDSMVSFPFHEWMPDDQFEYMLDATRETLDTLRRDAA